MANLNMNYDPTAVEPQAEVRREPFPAGRYVLQVIESDVKPSSSGKGTILTATIEVYEGPYKGRQLFENFNIQNDNMQAQEIGQRQLSALCAAAAITNIITDSQELHYHPFEADVEIEPESTSKDGKTYKAKNRIRKYIIAGAAEPPAAKAAPVRAAPKPAPAPVAKTGSRPWERRAG